MAHTLKLTEWQSPTGHWYANDVSDLAGIAGKWWVPARLLGISLEDYVLLLKDTYNATIVKYNAETDILIYYWNNYNDMHKFVLFLNKRARQENFIV